jgi:GTP-binding protein HflX
MDQLAKLLASELPRPDLRLEVLIPYERGDLIDRLHRKAQVLSQEHTDTGTALVVLVGPEFKDALEPFTIT